MAQIIARDVPDVIAAVTSAIGTSRPLEIIAGGTRRALGVATHTVDALDVSCLSGVVDYQPGELILTAGPATLMSDLADLLGSQGQMFAFEPASEAQSTLGGALMVGCSGSRRPFAGSARDHFLGFHAVSGRGEAFKAGGKVVKNVTGYDLPKIFAGSYGTLGVLNEVTVKVMPRPELTQTLIATIDDIADGFDVLRGIMRGDYEVSGLALLPCVLSPNGKSSLLIRLEGTPKSVAARKQNLLAHVGLTQVDVLDYDPWYQLGHGAYLQKSPTLWRISLPPARVMTLVAQLDDNTWYADWAGGRLFWTGDVSDDAGAARLRTLLGGQGHAMLVRADAGLRAAVAVFEPMPAGLVALSRQIKAQFDPMAVLNPGRMGF